MSGQNNNKKIARRVREEIWNQKNLALADELIGAKCVHHTHDSLISNWGNGPGALKQVVSLYRTAFPDGHFTIEDTICEGDKVVIRWTARGTHVGQLLGMAPTGRPVTVTGVDIYRIVKGKIEEIWVNWDARGLLKQLGLMAQAAR